MHFISVIFGVYVVTNVYTKLPAFAHRSVIASTKLFKIIIHSKYLSRMLIPRSRVLRLRLYGYVHAYKMIF